MIQFTVQGGDSVLHGSQVRNNLFRRPRLQFNCLQTFQGRSCQQIFLFVLDEKLEVLLLIISGIQPVKACKYSLHKRTSKVRAQKETVRYQRLVRIGLLREIFTRCLFSLLTMNNEKRKERESSSERKFHQAREGGR